MKAMAAPMEHGHLVGAIDKLPKAEKPVLDISARMSSGFKEDKTFHKSQVDRLRKEIKAIEDEVANWDHETVGKKALRSLQTELATKKARLMESEALLDEQDEGKKEKAGEGAVVGGPYEIIMQDGKHVVKNMQNGKVHGTFPSREKALKQFRLLEGIEHGWKPTNK